MTTKAQSATERRKLLGNVSSKAQSAMEYLMTYGWAILVIAVVLGVLYYLGIFSPSNFAPKAQPGSCQIFRPNGPGTNYDLNLEGTCSGELPQYVAQFNGQTSQIVVSNNANLAPQQITVALWVNNLLVTSTNYDQLILSKYPDSHPKYGYSLLWGYGNDLHWRASDAGTATDVVVINALPRTNGWYFIVATFQPDNQTLYVNGKLLGTNNLGFSIDYNSSDLYIGKAGSTTRLEGDITNVQIYNISLNSSFIDTLYNEGIGGAPVNLQHLVGWWPLNGNANGYSGNNNNGVPTNVIFTGTWQSGYTPP